MASKDVRLLLNTWYVLHFDLSILHIFMNEMILWKYVLTSSMKTGFVVRAITNLLSTSSPSLFSILYNNFLSYIAYFVVFVAAINSGSHDDKTTVGCFCNVQVSMINRKRIHVLMCSSRHQHQYCFDGLLRIILQSLEWTKWQETPKTSSSSCTHCTEN